MNLYQLLYERNEADSLTQNIILPWYNLFSFVDIARISSFVNFEKSIGACLTFMLSPPIIFFYHIYEEVKKLCLL